MRGAFFKAATWRGVWMASSMVTGMCGLRLFKTYLKPETYGIVAFALAAMAYLPYLDGGFRMLLNRKILVSKDEAERIRLIRFGQSLYQLLGLVFMLLGTLVMAGYSLTPSARNSGLPLAFFLTLGAVNGLTLLAAAQSELLYGLQQQAKMYIIQAGGSWIVTSMLAWGFASGWSVWAFPFSAMAAFAVVFPLSIRWIRQTLPAFKWLELWYDREFWALFHELRGEAWHCCRMQISGIAMSSADIMIIGAFFPKDFAAYFVLARLTGIMKGVLQIGGEVCWPFFARREERKVESELVWFRLHSWIYGAVVGALLATLIPFCVWWMSKDWVVGPVLLWLVALRLLVAGVSSGVIYLYYGTGQFRIISRSFQAELVIGLLLTPLGRHFYGLNGVAAAFLIGAMAGSGWPLYRTYAKQLSISVFPILAQVWVRALAGMAISYSVARLLLGWTDGGILTPLIGAAGVLICLMVMAGLSIARGGWSGGGLNSELIKSLARKV